MASLSEPRSKLPRVKASGPEDAALRVSPEGPKELIPA
jgi:hypothetical protein